jgi:hypothetical protein
MLSGLRPYQFEIAAAVLDSVFHRKGLTFSVEIARQGGKNELSARLERHLLTLNLENAVNLVKCSPTFKPQTVISMMRLKDRLNDAGLNGVWTSEMGYIIRLGEARAIFLSADVGASVVGNTAHLLLEVDESQDVNQDKYTKEFKPMSAASNCTIVHYGTTWDDSTLLEEVKQTNLELEKRDGIRRHFRYDYQEVGQYNPYYLINVEMERQRLGENHPLFLTQYRLLPVRGGGGFLNSTQKAQLQGEHNRLSHPPEKTVILENSKHHPSQINNLKSTPSPAFINHSPMYVAGIDLAGEAESAEDHFLTSLHPRRDSTVVTIGELDWSICNDIQKQPCIRVVEHYSWTGEPHAGLYPTIIDLLKNVWHCKRVVVDSTGVGEPVAAFLKQSLGHRVVGFKFTARSKSDLGFNLLSAVNSGRLKMYSGDGSPEYREMWFELDKAKSFYRPNQTFNFFVDTSDGHDDFLMSLALLVESAGLYEPRTARGKIPVAASPVP